MAANKPEIPSLAGLVDKVKSGEAFNEIKKVVLESQVWTSSFRHGYADTPRNRVLQIASNVWLSVPADATVIFNTPFQDRWAAAAALLGVDISQLSIYSGHA